MNKKWKFWVKKAKPASTPTPTPVATPIANKNPKETLLLLRRIRSFRRRSYLTNLIISRDKQRRATVTEKVIKFIIYAALRLVIRPSSWKDPKRNYLLIDKAYERIVSPDFIYIPSSLAFYIIMAFVPICSVVLLINSLDFMRPVLQVGDRNALQYIFGDFIPGLNSLLDQIGQATNSSSPAIAQVGAYTSIVAGLLISAWIASGGFAKLVFTQSHMYGHRFVGGYWMNRLKGGAMVAAFTLYLIIVLIVNVAGVRGIEEAPGLNSVGKQALRYIFLFISLFGFVFLGIAFLYRYSPRFKTRWKWILPGAVTTTLPTVGFLVLIGVITSRWSYGSFGSLSVIMYISMASLIITYFIFVGITVNAAYHHAFVGHIEKKWTLSRK